MKSTTSEMMSHADDLLFAMKELAGTDDMAQGVIVMKDIHQLVQDATGFDRANDTDDSTMALSYVIDIQEIAVAHIQGIPSKGVRKAA